MDLKSHLGNIIIFTVILPGVRAIPCSQLTCSPPTLCKEVFDRTSGLVLGQCLTNPEVTGNESTCQRGTPLFVAAAPQPIEASCAPNTGSRNVPACPPDYFCFFNPPICCPAFSKPSTCPATQLDGRIGGVCVNACGSDAQCPLDQKCCTTACGGTGCQSPTATCGNRTCGAGQRCVLLQGSCLIPPCPPVPTCISEQGVCPSPTFSWDLYLRWCFKECISDTQCRSLYKCCPDYFGCGSRCQPGIPPLTCRNMTCSRNQRCVMRTDTSCTSLPCYNIPACVNTAAACNPACGSGYVCDLITNPTTRRQEFRCLPFSQTGPGGVCDEACQRLLLLLAMAGASH